jgi:hypothetical protein
METQKLGTSLKNTVEKAYQRLHKELDEASSSKAPAPGKWSPKQVIGHLVDSASNNHQRFVRANFKNDLCFAGYRQAEWVELQDYQHMDWQELLVLWRSFNLLIARVMEQTPAEILRAERQKHDLDKIAFYRVATGQPATLAYFMEDYIIHLEHHLAQVLSGYERLFNQK